jgi:hypothetical protein
MLLAAAPSGSELAQSLTLQRIEEEAKQSKAEKIEAPRWRSFPQEASKTKSPKGKDASPPVDGLRDFNPLALGGFLDPARNSPDRLACSYKWTDWKLDLATGVRMTLKRCYRASETRVAVHCSTVKIIETFFTTRGSWLQWRLPGTEGEREMLAALCDNLRLAPR